MNAKRAPAPYRNWLLFVVIGVLIVAGTALVLGVSVGYRALKAEQKLHAVIFALGVVETYLRENNGRWPRSWQELEQVSFEESNYAWPRDSEWVQQHVAIDFGADRSALAKQAPTEFDAVKPKGACYEYRHYTRVSRILDLVSIPDEHETD